MVAFHHRIPDSRIASARLHEFGYPPSGEPISSAAYYDPDADLDRNGIINGTDSTLGGTNWAAALARGVLSSGAVDNATGYDGYRYNPETMQYTVRNRWYDPVLGRWLQRDPAGYMAEMGLYTAFFSNPVRFGDGFGLYPGLPGHGTKISPSGSVRLVRNYQTTGDNVWTAAMAGPLASVFTPASAYDQNSFRLTSISRLIGTGVSNRFVYTCKWGWIDMGHYFNNASIVYFSNDLHRRRILQQIPKIGVLALPGLGVRWDPEWYNRTVAWVASYVNEMFQYMGLAPDSAFSPEDFLSNARGRDLGISILSAGERTYDIGGHWEMFLARSGAIKWGVTHYGRLSQDILQGDMDAFLANPYYGANGVSGDSEAIEWKNSRFIHRCLCNGDVPINKSLEWSPADM